MVKLCFAFIVLLAMFSCKTVQKSTSTEKGKIAIEENDSVEYELIVFDPGYDTYIQSLPYPKDYYSNDYYQSWNRRYVDVWNYRCGQPSLFGDFYDTTIYYDSLIDYGLEFNFRLYHYFLFIEKQYGITLIKRPRISS